MARSHLEIAFERQLGYFGLPEPEREYRFHPTRQWRFDFCWPEHMLAVELEGGTWANGRHTRGSGYAEDCDKYNQAALLGWRVLRFTASSVNSGAACLLVEEALKDNDETLAM